MARGKEYVLANRVDEEKLLPDEARHGSVVHQAPHFEARYKIVAQRLKLPLVFNTILSFVSVLLWVASLR